MNNIQELINQFYNQAIKRNIYPGTSQYSELLTQYLNQVQALEDSKNGNISVSGENPSNRFQIKNGKIIDTKGVFEDVITPTYNKELVNKGFYYNPVEGMKINPQAVLDQGYKFIKTNDGRLVLVDDSMNVLMENVDDQNGRLQEWIEGNNLIKRPNSLTEASQIQNIRNPKWRETYGTTTNVEDALNSTPIGIMLNVSDPVSIVGAVSEWARTGDGGKAYENYFKGQNKGVFELNNATSNWANEHPYLSTAANIGLAFSPLAVTKKGWKGLKNFFKSSPEEIASESAVQSTAKKLATEEVDKKILEGDYSIKLGDEFHYLEDSPVYKVNTTDDYVVYTDRNVPIKVKAVGDGKEIDHFEMYNPDEWEKVNITEHADPNDLLTTRGKKLFKAKRDSNGKVNLNYIGDNSSWTMFGYGLFSKPPKKLLGKDELGFFDNWKYNNYKRNISRVNPDADALSVEEWAKNKGIFLGKPETKGISPKYDGNKNSITINVPNIKNHPLIGVEDFSPLHTLFTLGGTGMLSNFAYSGLTGDDVSKNTQPNTGISVYDDSGNIIELDSVRDRDNDVLYGVEQEEDSLGRVKARPLQYSNGKWYYQKGTSPIYVNRNNGKVSLDLATPGLAKDSNIVVGFDDGDFSDTIDISKLDNLR